MPQIRRNPQLRQILLAASTPYYFKFKLSGDIVSAIQVAWHDATSNFTVTAYSSCYEDPDVPDTAAAGPDLEYWFEETDISITGAAASAAGSEVVHVGNMGAKWLLLKVEPSADSDVSFLTHGKV